MYKEPKDTFFYPKKTLNAGGKIMDCSSPIVMGILNVTPDSFFDGGKYNDEKSILEKVESMAKDGASIIDIGGYSSRPGSIDISIDEEIRRVTPALQLIRKEIPEIILSIDTYRAKVAEAAIENGASIINDISGGTLDSEMFPTVSKLQVPYILMHMKGNPQTMSHHTDYKHLILDIVDYFQQKISALRKLNVKDILLDPGFGFSKTMEQNYDLLKNIGYFKVLGLPLLAGISRKSMIYKKLNIEPKEALNGSTVLNSIALMNNVNILRVHDVKEAMETITLYKTTYN